MKQRAINDKTPGKKSIKLNAQYRLREGLLLVLFLLSFYLLLALSTYHNTDSAWSTTGNGFATQNAAGQMGAFLADTFLYAMGYCAYILPVFLIAWSIFVFRHRHDSGRWLSSLVRWTGFVLFILSVSALFSLYVPQAFLFPLPLNSGGVLGQMVNSALVDVANRWGATLILMTTLLIGLTFMVGVSWLYLARAVMKGGYKLTTQLGIGIKKMCARREKLIEASLPFDEDEITAPIQQAKITLAPMLPLAMPVASKEPLELPVKSMTRAKPVKKTVTSTGLPNLNLLDDPTKAKKAGYSAQQVEALSQQLEHHLKEFGIAVKVSGAYVGPVITRFELELAPGMKVSRITTLAKDLARALSTSSVRVVEVIPGKSVIGLEIPNESREIVRLKEILQANTYQKNESYITLALGKDIAGHAVSVDLAKMPHLLVAGTTGSGKSVSINAMILSFLFKATPEEVRLLMIDPKMLELSIYEGIPHLLAPVVTDMKEAANVLRWCVAEMDRRYRLMAALSVRNLVGFNQKVQAAIDKGKPMVDPLQPAGLDEESTVYLQKLPQIVLVIDELADMMMVVGKKVEELIARIAQKARAAGIHMILATQRPSVDVITGLIKANIPTRIAFQVSSRIDSRTILDQQGAEHLLGHGDMLYLPAGTSLPVRVHGAFVSDEEVFRVVEDWKERGSPEYLDEITQDPTEAAEGGVDSNAEADPLYDQAVAIVIESRRPSISSIQRRLKIGYNRAARIMDAMEAAGLVSTMDVNGGRELLMPNK